MNNTNETTQKDDCINNQPENLIQDDENFDYLYEEDFANINIDRDYRRAPLILLACDKFKGILNGQNVNQCYNTIMKDQDEQLQMMKINLEQVEFYYYNCESVKDYGWGCAWRCIQTLIGTIRNIFISKGEINQKLKDFDLNFQNLFLTYGHRSKLDSLFLAEYKPDGDIIPSYLQKRKYTPFESMDGWAEPFIAKLILADFDVHGELFLLNLYNPGAYAPIEVFSRTVNFQDLKKILIDYFMQPDAAPVIIDDTLITICVAGICENSDGNCYLLILDPHVAQDCEGATGIYYVLLNEQGDFEESKNPQPNLKGNLIKLSSKGWMIFIPKIGTTV